MRKVLITGANGFIGRQTLPILRAMNYEIHAVSTILKANDHDTYWHQADLLAKDAAQQLIKTVKPTHLLHFAWNTEPGKYWSAKNNEDWMQKSFELLKAFHQNGGERIVMAGTCAEYDWQQRWFSEGSTSLKPHTYYGQCKNELRTLLEDFSNQQNLSWAWGKVFFLYGPYEHPDRLVSSVIRALIKRKLAECTSGEQIRDFMHVMDAASAFCHLLNSDVQGPVNISSGIPVSVKSIILKIADLTNGHDLVKLGARPQAKDDPPLIVGDIMRLKNEVKWQPSYTLEQGLARTIDWWRQNL